MQVQLRQVEKVERRDRRADPVGRHAGQRAALGGERYQLQLVQDVDHQPGIGEVVLHEPFRVMAVGIHDLRHVIDAAERLALAENLPRRVFQGVAVQAVGDRAQQADAVQHHPPRDEDRIAEPAPARAPRARTTGLTRVRPLPSAAALTNRPRGAAQFQGHLQLGRPADQHRHVEVDDVPAGHHVGVEGTHPPAQGRQQIRLAGTRHGSGRAGGARRGVRAQQQHLARAAPPQRHRQQALRLGVGLDVERQRGELRRPARRLHLRLVEHHRLPRRVGRHLCQRPRGAVDAQGALDAAVDQVAVGKAHVRLVGGNPFAVQTAADRRGVAGVVQPDAVYRRAMQGTPVGRVEVAQAKRPRLLDGAALDVEVGLLAAVAHQEGTAVGEPAVQMHDRAAAVGFGNVGGVEDESEVTGPITLSAGHSLRRHAHGAAWSRSGAGRALTVGPATPPPAPRCRPV